MNPYRSPYDQSDDRADSSDGPVRYLPPSIWEQMVVNIVCWLVLLAVIWHVWTVSSPERHRDASVKFHQAVQTALEWLDSVTKSGVDK